MSHSSEGASRLRLDKWLWAARFFKTRALAAEAVEGGKVHLNDQRTKPAHAVHVGDRLRITRGDEMFEIVTLIQTRQVKPCPVILAGDSDYWAGLLEWVGTTLLQRGKIAKDDVNIFRRARTPQEVLLLLQGSLVA